jgi:hypothetical protein
MDYLNQYSNMQITRKIRLSSGNPEYFYLYKANILCNFEDYPALDDGETAGVAGDNFRVTTTFSTEFWCPLNYFLETKLDVDVTVDPEDAGDPLRGEFVVNFTMPTLPPEELGDGKRLIVWQGYIADVDGVDELDVAPALNEELKEVIEYYNTHRGNLNEKSFEIVLFQDGEELPETDYLIDWKTLILTNVRPVKDSTYYFGIYGDVEEMRKTLEKIRNARGLQ